ncbi:hypothetical protein [Streptomyces olivaceoviridis]|uniref:hypothetical protein n=1 Tax=Streptomyces olivaceoviridis TaxID=1921 RepID=UPI0036F51876
MQPTTASRYPDTWHAAEHDQERAWLDNWMRGYICLVTLDACLAKPAAAPARPLATAGSC